MKRALVVILVVFLLFVFSSCERHPSIEERYESLQEEYFSLEEKYNAANGKLDDIYSDFFKAEDCLTTLYLYFDEHSASYDQAYDAYESLSQIFYKYY